jgi:hypothetical protein
MVWRELNDTQTAEDAPTTCVRACLRSFVVFLFFSFLVSCMCERKVTQSEFSKEPVSQKSKEPSGGCVPTCAFRRKVFSRPGVCFHFDKRVKPLTSEEMSREGVSVFFFHSNRPRHVRLTIR